MRNVDIQSQQTLHQKILREDLVRRCDKNPRYSLRAFARDLNLSASHLSGVLAGRYGLSREGAIDIAKRLSLSKLEAQIFIQSVASRHGRSKALREAATLKLRDLQSQNKDINYLQLDQFKMIADWFHFAILELTYLKSFKPDIGWIAKTLGIRPETAGSAVSRLKRLKVLVTEGRRWFPSTAASEAGMEVPSAAIKTFHAQILQKASQAIYFQPVEQRDFRSTILAIRKDRLPEAKKALEKLHQEFCSEISGNDPGFQDEVYCLATQLFSLTTTQETSK